jgi:hypothetical protein
VIHSIEDRQRSNQVGATRSLTLLDPAHQTRGAVMSSPLTPGITELGRSVLAQGSDFAQGVLAHGFVAQGQDKQLSTNILQA